MAFFEHDDRSNFAPKIETSWQGKKPLAKKVFKKTW